MRQKLTRQMSIFSVTMRHDIGKELAAFSEILDATPKMLDLVYADLTRAARKDTGREGMTAEQGQNIGVAKHRCQGYTFDNIPFSDTLDIVTSYRRRSPWEGN